MLEYKIVSHVSSYWMIMEKNKYQQYFDSKFSFTIYYSTLIFYGGYLRYDGNGGKTMQVGQGGIVPEN